MTSKVSFVPLADTTSYAYLEHYLKIEDSKGKQLFLKTFDTEESLKKEYQEINLSKEPYSFVYRTFFPVRYDSITHFFQTLFIPQTLTLLAPLKSRVAKVALGIFTVLFDMMTLLVRLLTSIPYIVYYNCFNRSEDHKIIAMIRNNPDAAHALAEGKVVVRSITEDFSHIQPGSMDGKSCYQVEGNVYARSSEVYIKHSLYGDKKKNSEGAIGYSGNMNASMKSHYRAFQVL